MPKSNSPDRLRGVLQPQGSFVEAITLEECSLPAPDLASLDLSVPVDYSEDLNELRHSFNEDKNKIRLLMLLSPT